MKKSLLFALLLPTIIFSSCSTALDTNIVIKRANGDFSGENTTLASNLSGAYRLETIVTTSYDDESYKVNVESDEDHFNLSAYTADDVLISTYHYRNENGNAYLDTLDITNTVVSTDTEVNFATYFSGPFASLDSASDIDASFDVTEETDSLVYKANEYGLGLVNNNFLNSFGTFNSFTWDATSTTNYIKNLVITTDLNGNPSEVSFDLVTADRYGGVYEHYTGSFTSLTDTSIALAPLTPLMETTSSEYQALESALDDLYDQISGDGYINFIEHINMHDEEGDSLSYDNYYDFDLNNPGLDSETSANFMLSTNPLVDADYGATYTGLRYDEIYLYSDPDDVFPAFYAFGISPDSNYADILYSQYWEDMNDILPRVNDLSVDFFSYDSDTGVYTFDITEFDYDDYDFGIDVLDALVGQGDYLSHVLGTYTADGDFGYFDFTSITIQLGETIKFTLDYNYLGIASTAEFTFGSFGTTDLNDNEDLKACLELYDEIYGE